MFNIMAAKVARWLGEDNQSIAYSSNNSLFEEKSCLSDLLPYLAFDPIDNIFVNRQSAGFVFELSPLIGINSSQLEQLVGLFQHLLPEGSSLQLMLYGDPTIHPLLSYWQKLRQEELYKVLSAKRAGFVQGLREDNPWQTPWRARNFRLILSYSEDIKEVRAFDRERLQKLQHQMIATFKGLGMAIRLWGPIDLIGTISGILTPLSAGLSQEVRHHELSYNPHMSLSHQILHSPTYTQIHKDGLYQEQRCIRSYTLTSSPREWHQGKMSFVLGEETGDFLQIPCPFIVHYGIHVVQEKTLKARILGKCSQVEKQANSPLVKYLPSLKKQEAEWRFVREQFEEGARLVKTRYQVILMDNRDNIDIAENILRNLYRAYRFELTRSDYLHLPNLISILPMAWAEFGHPFNRQFNFLKTTLSFEPVNLLPLQGEWYGTKTPGLLLFGRRGQITFWHPFDNSMGNYNVCVVGRSGSGKSVFMQELMTSTLGLGGKVFVLDVGRSFEKTAKLLGGHFIEFTPNSSICLNPFSTIPTQDPKLTREALSLLKPVISLMASPQDGTTDLENSFIEQAIRSAWQTKTIQASIDDIATFLLNHRDQRANDLGQKLFPYTCEGMYGRYFNGPANIDLNHSLVVVELEELKERKDLQSVIIQMVILQITHQMFLGKRDVPFHLILDEAWDLLASEAAATFIQSCARKLRKYQGSLVTGTQSMQDFYVSPGARAAFENSDWLCLLSQKQESIEQLKNEQKINFDEGALGLLRSLKTKAGEYAEILIKGPQGYAVTRLILDPFSRTLYSTKPEEYAAVHQYLQKGLPLEQAITKVAEKLYG